MGAVLTMRGILRIHASGEQFGGRIRQEAVDRLFEGYARPHDRPRRAADAEYGRTILALAAVLPEELTPRDCSAATRLQSKVDAPIRTVCGARSEVGGQCTPGSVLAGSGTFEERGYGSVHRWIRVGRTRGADRVPPA